MNQVNRRTLEAPFNYVHLYFYDANNNVIREEIENKDTNGPNLDGFTTLTYEYDLLDNRIQKTEEVSLAETLITRYTYDRNENPVDLIQPEGNVVHRTYDERNLVFTVTRGFNSSGASTHTLTYDGNQNLLQVVDAADNTGDGQPEVSLIEYDGFDRRIRTVDGVGNVMTYNYDPASNQTREQHFGPNGGPSPTNTAGAGNVLLSEMTMKFDEHNREYEHNQTLFANTTTVGPEGPLTPADGLVTMRHEFDRNNRRTRVLDDNLHQRLFVYDGVDRVVQEIDELSNEILTSYDNNHNPIQTIEIERSPEGTVPDETFTTTRQFDTIDRLTMATDNLGNVRTSSYDSRNNITQLVDALGNTTTYVWDGINRKLEVHRDLRTGGIGSGSIDTTNPANPDGRLSRFMDWDGNSRLVSETDNNGNVTRYNYDALNRKIVDTFADGTTNVYRYDRDHNVVQFTDENQTTHTNVFDGINRAISKSVSRTQDIAGTTQWQFEYDGLSRLTKATDNNDPDLPSDDSAVEREYDSLSRLLTETQNGKVVATTFDGVGNRLALAYPNARVVEMAYDGLDRIDRLQDQDTTPVMIAEYDYLGPRRVIERRYRNGLRLRYHDGNNQDIGYDGIKRRTQHQHVNATDTLIAGFSYAYDKEHNRRYEADLFANLADVYEYDSAYRLTRTGFQVATNSLAGVVNNNTTNADVTGLTGISQNTYQLDGVGNWVQQGAGGSTIAFTANEMNEYVTVGGQAQTHDQNGNRTSDGNRTFVYDFANRVIQITDTSQSLVANYKYDALGRRIQKDVNGTVTTFFYDDARSIEERTGTDTVARQYVYGRGIDELLELTTNGQSFFYHDNTIGSVVALTNGSGGVQERYRYDPYGQVTILAADGVTVIPASTVGNPFGFTGRRLDSESEFYYYRARYYDPIQGRFLQRDPKGYIDGMGLYEYVTGNPVNWIDPLGMEKRNNGVVPPIPDRKPYFGPPIPPRKPQEVTPPIPPRKPKRITPPKPRRKPTFENFMNFIRRQEVEREAHEPFIVEEIAENWDDLPEVVRNWEPDDPWGQYVDDRGNHEENQRLPGGYHLTVDEPDGPVNLHFDRHDPLTGPNATDRHGTWEVLPLVLGITEEGEPENNKSDWR